MPIYDPVERHIPLLEETSEKQMEAYRRKALLSKIKGLQSHLEALLQKKIRLEFEIRSQKKKLSKLKSESKMLLKTKVELEGFQYDTLTPPESALLEQKVGPDVYSELLELQETVLQTENFLASLEEALPQ